VLLAASDANATTEVTTCGQTVSGSAFLSGDLDCSGSVGAAIILDGGTLDLRGFTVTASSTAGDGVTCTKSCKIVSDPPGGTFVAPGGNTSIDGDSGVANLTENIRIENVVVDGGARGIGSDHGSIVLIDSLVKNTTSFGIALGSTGRRVRLVRSTIENVGEHGIAATRVQLLDSFVQNAGEYGLFAHIAVVKGSTVTGNTLGGVHAGGRAKILDSTITGNGTEGVDGGVEASIRVVRSDVSGNVGPGVAAQEGPVRVIDSTVTNNGGDGVITSGGTDLVTVDGSTVTGNGRYGIHHASIGVDCPIRVVDSVATGNGTGVNCGVSETCADIAACMPPDVVGSTSCDRSYDIGSGFPGTSWGLCSLD